MAQYQVGPDGDTLIPVADPNAPLGSPQPATLSASNLSPDDIQYVASSQRESQYGTLPQQALAGIEGAARGGTLGVSDYLENELAKFNPALFGPEARRQREAENPVTSLIGNMIGGGALLAGTGGLSGPIEAATRALTLGTGVAGPLTASAETAAKLATFATEGGLFGAGNVVSDAALGDPNLNAQKVLSEIGMGVAIGTGLGVLSKGIETVPALLRRARGEASPAVAGAEPVVDLTPPTGKVPTDLEQMQERIDNSKKYGGREDLTDLPEKPIAIDANSRVGQDMQFPLTNMQLESLNDQDSRDIFRTTLNLPGKNGEILRNYQGAQKKELMSMMDKSINDIAPDYVPTTDAQEAGERASDLFTKVIQSNRNELGPAFEKIKSTQINDVDHLPGVLDYLTKPEDSNYANPKIANMFDTSGETLDIKPYNTGMGIDKATYNGIKDVVNGIQENPKDFSKLIDIRKGLSQNVDVTQLGDAPKEIAAAKAAMMDYIQDAIQSQEPDLAVRDTFRRWAVNEQNAQMIERKFGAEIGSGNFRSLAKGKPDEAILGKIFKDSELVDAVKQILPSQDFNKILADHMAILKAQATNADGVFSSKNFTRALTKEQYALNEAFQNGPADQFQRLKDALTLTRMFPDVAPINPSGTTKTFFQGMINAGLDPFKQIDNLFHSARNELDEVLAARRINASLAGTADQTNKLGVIQGMLSKVSDKITSGAKSIFSSPAGRGAILSGAVHQMTDTEYNKVRKKIGYFVANPNHLIDHLADNSDLLYQAAPQITQSMHQTIAQGMSYLASKLPRPPVEMPLSNEWQPSKAQKMEFSQFYQGINNPLTVLKSVKSGILSNNTMDAIQTVHPQLLNEMRQQVTSQMTIPKAKALPYSVKLSLAKFLGQPLDENMVPAAIISNQLALSSPNLSQQTSGAQAAKMPRGTRSTLGGLKELDFSGRARTATDRANAEA